MLLTKEGRLPVFVYGTLKVGGYFSFALNQYRRRCDEATLENATMYNLRSFPGVVIDDTGNEVVGEYHEYDNPNAVLKALDRIEGYAGPGGKNLYERITTNVKSKNGTLTAYTYVIGEQRLLYGSTIIPSGKWEL